MGKAKSVKRQTKKAASAIVGKLSKPGKMPCPSWSISAWACQTGQKLAKVAGSVCYGCYAMKNMYLMGCTKTAQARRLEKLQRAMADVDGYRETFIGAFETLLRGETFFRWHDAGDLQGHRHLDIICEIARRLPACKFWLPTREYQIVNTYLGAIPANLVIRASAHMVDGSAPAGFANTSTVHTGDQYEGFKCGAYTRKGVCGPCRECWKPEVKNISYPLH